MAINKVNFGNTTIIDITDTTATASDVSTGKYFYAANGEKVQGTAVIGGMTVVETTDIYGGTIVEISGDPVVLQPKSVTPSTSSQTVAPDSGYNGLSEVIVAAIPSQYVIPAGTTTITANGSGINVAAYASANISVTPNLQSKTNISPATSSQTISADNGYDGLSSVQINAMPAGTAGTPTATKGTVNNHQVSVTPSVTNVTGYITGGTKTGTAVTVSASELVSGSETKTANGTYDVTNLAELVVNVAGAKTKTGTFIGNGTRQVAITCDFEPDFIYWTSDPGTTASSGTVAGMIARGMMAANRYRNNATTNSANIQTPITNMNTSGSSYNFRATYANSTVTLYCFSNNARSLFTSNRTYSYTFISWS